MKGLFEKEPAGPPLVQSRESLEKILNGVADPIFVKDRAHRWILLNDACCELIGHPREALIGKSDYDFFPKEQADVFWEKDEAVFSSGRENVNEEEITDATGAVHTIVTKKTLHTEPDGTMILVGVIRDITQNKRIEEELSHQAALLRSQQESSLDGILIVDENGRIASFNSRFVEMWGIPAAILASRSDEKALDSVLHQLQDPAEFVARVRYLYQHRQERSREEIALKDGRTFDRYSAPVCGEDGRYYGRVWYFRDVTDERLAEVALRQTEERFRLLVEAVHDHAIYRLDPDGRISTWNHGAERIHGYRATEIIGRHYSSFFTAEDRSRGKPDLLLRIAAEGGRVEDEGWRMRKDGSRFWASATLTALKSPDGRLQGYAKVARDMTDRRKAEEELRLKSVELARSNAELEVFASAASHDLQDPLHKIIALSHLLDQRLGSTLPETEKGLIERIGHSAQRMSSLIEGLLKLSKVARETGPFEAVDLNAVAAGVLSDLETRLAQARARVEVGALPTVWGHPILMRQLLQNLIANALKFHKKGIPPLVRLTGSVHADGFAELTVTDDGIGFDPKHAERIFEPFLRLHARDEYDGHGLGLAICRRIAAKHGGAISARSKPQEGAAFTVYLPVVEARL